MAVNAYAVTEGKQLDLTQELAVTLGRFRMRRDELAKETAGLKEALHAVEAHVQLLDEVCDALSRVIERDKYAEAAPEIGSYR